MMVKTFAGLLLGSALIMPMLAAQGADKAEKTEKESSAAKLRTDARAALNTLYAKTPAAKSLGAKATAILVFPKVTKAGLVIGGQSGDGVLLKGGKPTAYYRTSGVSAGFQAGVTTYGYVLFFMNANALDQLDKADGFEVGVGPTLVVVDEGLAKNITTTTTQHDIYAFIFSQRGLMAGIGIQGNKVSKINPK